MISIAFYFYLLKLDQKIASLLEIKSILKTLKLSDEDLNLLISEYELCLDEAIEVSNKDRSTPLLKDKKEAIAKVRKALSSSRSYIEYAMDRDVLEWKNSGELLMRAYRLQNYSMHTLDPIPMISKASSFLKEISKQPYVSAIKTINAFPVFDEIRKTLSNYKSIVATITENEQDKRKITGTAAAKNTYDWFEKIYIYVYSQTLSPKNDDKYSSIHRAFNEVIEKYNMKARVNKTRQETRRGKKMGDDSEEE